MRIRRLASRVLGSAYAARPPDAATPFELPTPPPPPPPPPLAPCSAPESRGGGGLEIAATASAVACELNRSPWDLLAELNIPNPQVEDELLDRFFVSIVGRASWLLPPSMPAASVKEEELAAPAARAQPRRVVAKKAPKKAPVNKEKAKESEGRKKAKVQIEEGEGKGAAQVWKCKKRDNKRWQCHRTVSRPNTLCKYHFLQKRSYLDPDFAVALAEVEVEASAPVAAAASKSKPSTRSKPRRKRVRADLGATEGFYYYAGFGPFRSKRQCRSSMQHDSVPVPAKQEEDEELPEDAFQDQARVPEAEVATNSRAVGHDDVSSCDDIAGIAGGDEESSDDDWSGFSGRDVNGNSEPRASNADNKRTNPGKRGRKAVKARSLKSLM